MAASSTFSESWHRVANQRVSLRRGVQIRRQNYRGERWHIVENPFNNDFFSLTPAAYSFISRLDGRRTVDEVWRETLEKAPDQAPSQQETLELLAQLYLANLLQYDAATDSAALFERFRKRKQRELRGRFLNIMFMRFPLLDPDRFLVRTLPVIGKFITGFGFLIWLAVVGTALKVAFDNWDSLRAQSQGVLAPGNLPLLYVGLIIIKTLHEFGHAYFTRKFGGEVHTMGVLLMIFTPVPYMDASAAWSFRSRRQRLLVGAAGMIVEVFFAAIAMFIWANTGQGTLNALAYNIIFVASVSTVLFNANPLLRFDGYFMLSDLLEIPNLSQRANQQLRYLFERGLFGVKKAESPANTKSEAAWFTVFGITSGIYRIIVFGGILLVVADHFFLIGIVMAVACFISWITVPIGKLIHYLAASPKLERNRPRAIFATTLLLAGIIGTLQFLPFPSRFRAPGVAQAREWTQVINEAPGEIAELLTTPGGPVAAGQPLIRLNSPQLEIELRYARASVEEVETRIRSAVATADFNLKPLYGMMETATNRVAKLLRDQAALTITARHDGLWVSPEMKDYLGRWLPRGTRLGLVINPREFQFTSVVRQEDAERLFGRELKAAQIRLYGEVKKKETIIGERWEIVPGGQGVLPTPALGWQGGGDIPVRQDDTSGTRTTEPFFEVNVAIPSNAPAHLLHGRTGRIRFEQTPEPLLPRWIRALRQLIQKRYQL